MGSQVIETLERSGYAVELITRDGLQQVVARRTDGAQLSPKAAAPFLLALSRNQDEALEVMRSRRRGELYRDIALGQLAPEAEARAIAEYNLIIGNTTTSDGLKWADLM